MKDPQNVEENSEYLTYGLSACCGQKLRQITRIFVQTLVIRIRNFKFALRAMILDRFNAHFISSAFFQRETDASASYIFQGIYEGCNGFGVEMAYPLFRQKKITGASKVAAKLSPE